MNWDFVVPATSQHFLFIVIDLVLIYFLIYGFLLWLQGTRAISLMNGFVILLLITEVSRRVGLTTFSWVLKMASNMLLVALPIVFQPELRRTLEQLGNRNLITQLFFKEKHQEIIFSVLKEAAAQLSKTNTGALIVLSGNDSLSEITETGAKLDAIVSPELIINIFHPKTPLHDGAIIIRNNRIIAAKCILPLSEMKNPTNKFGTRHLAALGMSEQSDATILVVSEETGAISVARFGKLTRYIPADKLPDFLMKVMKEPRKEEGTSVRSYAPDFNL